VWVEAAVHAVPGARNAAGQLTMQHSLRHPFRTTLGTAASAARTTPRRPLWLIIASSLWMAGVGNAALWRELSQLGLLTGAHGALLASSLALITTALLVVLLSLFAWPRVLKPAITLLLLATAFGLHFMWAYHVVIDPTMMVNVMQTDLHETRDLFSMRLLVTVLGVGVLPAVLVWRTPLRTPRWPMQLAHNAAALFGGLALCVGAALAGFQPLSSAMRNHKDLRYLLNPLNSVYALGHAAAKPLRHDRSVLTPIGQDAHLGSSYAQHAKPPLLVLVLGETGRAGNFALNGYARNTTPELARLGVASQHNAWSCGTSTAASVPCMFSNLGRAEFDSRRTEVEGLLDVAQRAGLAVLWLDNQSGCKGVCDRVPNASTTATQDADLCPGGECQDGILLKGLDERLAALPAERRARGVLLVMHQMGSHGPAYAKRSPAAFKRFLPECTSNSLQDCSHEQLVNAYDNSIAYTDHFLAATVQWLQARSAQADTAMVYVADHGESLGENNLYLHGLPYAVAPDVQKRVPWITWLSPGFEQRSGVSMACLRGALDAPVSHDNYFHSVLGLLDVQTGAYQRPLDLYAPCAQG
jgi:lipid A ethanolaminephosphotransferase